MPWTLGSQVLNFRSYFPEKDFVIFKFSTIRTYVLMQCKFFK